MAIQWKIAKIFPPRVFCTSAEGIGIWFRLMGSIQLEWWGYRTEKEVWRYLQPSRYNALTWQTGTGRQQRPRLRVASRS